LVGSVVGFATQPYPARGPPPSFRLRNHPESYGFFLRQEIRTHMDLVNGGEDIADWCSPWQYQLLPRQNEVLDKSLGFSAYVIEDHGTGLLFPILEGLDTQPDALGNHPEWVARAKMPKGYGKYMKL